MKSFHFLFYTSSHGLGHSTRMIEVANNIPSCHKVTFATCAPEWIYRSSMTRPYSYRIAKIDTGVIQKDFLTVCEEETLRDYSILLDKREKIIKEEITWNKTGNVDMIISDIPPLAFPVAKKLSVPSIGIANFSWDWIYIPMIKKYPAYSHIIKSIQRDYKLADLVLSLPINGDMTVFPFVKPLTLIVRKSRLSRKEIRKKLKMDEKRKLILCSFSNFSMVNIDFAHLSEELKDFILISFNGEFPGNYNNIIKLDNCGNISHEEAVAAADIVVCKPGYGMVAEAIVNRTPVLYISRKDYIENTVLVEGLHKYGIAEEISKEDFLSGNWRVYINKLLSCNKTWQSIDSSGAKTAVKEIFNFLEK